jgi:predicted 3-demethylubiquinone-9 3-methyltransferase (glyoxalase superfamily)
MFQGNAEEAMNYYISLIEDSDIIRITRYGVNDTGEEGSVVQAVFSLKGQEFMCFDSNTNYDFTFTPSLSLFMTCDMEEEITRLYRSLTEGGNILMPLNEYPFCKKFGWIVDKFGVSWQLTLPK